jgi:hypothetical protein
MMALEPGGTVVLAAPPPWPVTAWKSTLWGMALPSGLVMVKRRTSPTRARIMGPGVPDTKRSSPAMR